MNSASNILAHISPGNPRLLLMPYTFSIITTHVVLLVDLKEKKVGKIK